MSEDTLRDSILTKEFDCNKWDNHPREMWVWNHDESDKVKRFVVHIEKGIAHPILAVDKEEGYYTEWWKYCAEIDQTKSTGTKEECEQWRPFKDCDELIETYKEERCSDLGEHELPIIWVRPIGGNTGGDMITDFNAISVRVLGNWWSLRDLFKAYTFLDGSTCGVKE